MHCYVLIAQAAPASPFLSVDNIFWLTILAIFILTIVSAVLRRITKDKALKLFHDYHVAFFSERRLTIWGDLIVRATGIELLFDRPVTTRRKLLKSSALVYEDEFAPMICLTRSVYGLNDEECRDRVRQIRRTYNPGMFRRSKRWMRNALNTLRDAIAKSVGLVIGRITRTDPAGAALSSQAGDINSLTGTVLNLAANAYEPLLERYIGKPVVLEIIPPGPPGTELLEFPGYLVDYTARFVAVFNEEQPAIETIDIQVAPGQPPVPEVPGLKIDANAEHTVISCEGKDAFVLVNLCCTDVPSELGVAIIPGTSLILSALEKPGVLRVERTRHIDLIVPRTRARIRFGSTHLGERRQRWSGLSPLLEWKEKDAETR